MTPKEKAKELFDKFYDTTGEHWNAHKVSIECALIAVDEVILEQCKSSEKKDARYQDERLKYWQEVKKEIELL